MSGVEAYLAKTVLTAALGAGRSYLEAAATAERETVERCELRLLAAKEAVFGLEREYRHILSDVATRDLQEQHNRDLLLARINRYLRDENLRPILVGALGGLLESLITLRTVGPRRFLQRPRARKQVLERFELHLEKLVGYQESLDRDFALRPYDQPSGIGMDNLLGIEQELQRPKVEIADKSWEVELKRRVEKMQQEASPNLLLAHAREVGTLCEQLRRAIR